MQELWGGIQNSSKQPIEKIRKERGEKMRKVILCLEFKGPRLRKLFRHSDHEKVETSDVPGMRWQKYDSTIRSCESGKLKNPLCMISVPSMILSWLGRNGLLWN